MYGKAAFCWPELAFRKMCSVACGFSSVNIHYSVNRINEVHVFFNKISLLKKSKLHL